MTSRKNSSLIEVVYVGKIIMILFLTMSSCQRQVSCHKGDIEIIDVLNRNHPIEINRKHSANPVFPPLKVLPSFA